jgi:hypothetical protein
MNPLLNVKFAELIAPQAIADDAALTAANYVDTAGWDWATCIFHIGATDIAMAALRMLEGDTTSPATEIAATNFADTTQVDWAGTAIGLPASTADNTYVVVQLDLRKRKRYLKAAATAGNGSAGTYLEATCILSKGEIAPITNTAAGATVVVV